MRHRLLLASLLLAGAAAAAAGQRTGSQPPPLGAPSFSGADIFGFYCASCHGIDARGGGPVAAALKAPPPDLTQLSRRNGGVFPRQRIEMFVTSGRTDAPAHGTSDMPVWGPIFRALDQSDTLATVRVENVVRYLESLQVK
jgi:mono/diheme cytochrome c family protein